MQQSKEIKHKTRYNFMAIVTTVTKGLIYSIFYCSGGRRIGQKNTMFSVSSQRNGSGNGNGEIYLRQSRA